MKYILFITTLLVTGGCSPQIRVYSDHDPDYQVWNFKTYDWGQKTNIEANKNPLYYNELNDKRIKSAILQQLGARGYECSEKSPELIIHYHIIVDDQSVVTTEPYGYMYGPHWMRMRTNVYSYREGTLIIDLMDAQSNSLVWRGWATAALDAIAPGQTEEIINRSVEKIFRKFPRSVREQAPVVSNTDTH